jgi:hypothetical protein
MKRIFLLTGIVVGIIGFSAAFVNREKSPLPSPTVDIPDSVWAVFEKCCTDCHGTMASGLAKSKLNFDKWEAYPAEKQAAKAASICSIMKKGKMPPRNYLDNNPGSAPNETEINRVCDWAGRNNR